MTCGCEGRNAVSPIVACMRLDGIGSHYIWSVGGVEQRGVNEAWGDGFDAHRGQFQRQGGRQSFHGR
jgi:hypothetical protein